ncbi:protein-export chaperone SecB [Magnetospira sp. QH-2]|uniref:protein-export chaperone SecB n=1 Tax=Magnetospira sp. (strain QH-2) TaxID=1288970 RepID=UPI0003E80DF7|nr:protein-export chaperone SecB [Magnetospira sp. QH-2]CCQ75627.1 protein-export protein SecB [Magnetospira sp. QH-2]
MAETPTGDAPEQQNPPLVINGQYIKDLSFEAPNAPAVFGALQKGQPDVNIGVDVNARPLQDNLFEVELHVRAQCKAEDSVAFIAELVYAGLFSLNVPDEHREPVLLVECPRMLFPFARSILADVTRDGGFPPLMLSMIDFVAMYQRNKQEAAAKAEGGDAAADMVTEGEA